MIPVHVPNLRAPRVQFWQNAGLLALDVSSGKQKVAQVPTDPTKEFEYYKKAGAPCMASEVGNTLGNFGWTGVRVAKLRSSTSAISHSNCEFIWVLSRWSFSEYNIASDDLTICPRNGPCRRSVFREILRAKKGPSCPAMLNNTFFYSLLFSSHTITLKASASPWESYSGRWHPWMVQCQDLDFQQDKEMIRVISYANCTFYVQTDRTVASNPHMP